MIQTKEDLKRYLEADQDAIGIRRKFRFFDRFSKFEEHKNTEPPSAGAGSMLGGLLRDKKQLLAPFQLGGHCTTVMAGAVAQTLACRRFCGLRSFASGLSSVSDWTANGPRNGTNRKRLAIFLLPSSAAALLHYLQPSTKYAWSLDLTPKAKR